MPQPDKGISDEIKLQALQEAEKKALNGNFRPKTAKNGGNPKYTSSSITPEQIRAFAPYFVDLGKKPPLFHPKRAKWYLRKWIERRKLRKNLRQDYEITKRSEFETVAREVGLGIDNPVLAFLGWFLSWLTGAGGIASILGAAALILGSMFAYSYIVEQVGSFTIQLNNSTLQDGFVLSDTPDFEVVTGRLISEELYKANAMSISDLRKDADLVDGNHNTNHSVMYTFYIQNQGDKTSSYEYVLSMDEALFDTEQAVWVLLFEDGKQIIYAEPSADGDEERLWGYTLPPFFDSAYAPEEQYYFYCRDLEIDKSVQKDQLIRDKDGTRVKFTMDKDKNIRIVEGNLTDTEREEMLKKANGDDWVKIWGIKSTPYLTQNEVVRGIVEDVEPGEYHKYTVVLWLEGNDPECTDKLFGGYAKYTMEFNPITEENFNLFANVYRTEYDITP